MTTTDKALPSEQFIERVYDELPKQGLEQEPYYSLTAIRTILRTAAALEASTLQQCQDALRECRAKFVGYLHYDEIGPVVQMIDRALGDPE